MKKKMKGTHEPMKYKHISLHRLGKKKKNISFILAPFVLAKGVLALARK
jgi:hypothetical protein